MSDEKDFKKKFEKATNKEILDNAKKLYPVSDKDKEILDKDIKILKESGTNSYASENKKIIKALKKD